MVAVTGAGLRASAGLLAVATASVAAPAAGQTGPVYARAVERTVERFIVPGYAALSAAGEGLVGSIEPSLVRLDRATGDLLDRATPPGRLRKLSIRHIAEAERGTIWFGGQCEGPRTDSVALVGCHRRGQELDFLPAPRTVLEAMRAYVGAVAASRDGARVAVTSPRGGRLVIWNARSRKVVETRRIADVCGVASGDDGFFASDGKGRIWRGGEVVSRRDGVQWDNHLAVAGPAGRVGPAG